VVSGVGALEWGGAGVLGGGWVGIGGAGIGLGLGPSGSGDGIRGGVPDASPESLPVGEWSMLSNPGGGDVRESRLSGPPTSTGEEGAELMGPKLSLWEVSVISIAATPEPSISEGSGTAIEMKLTAPCKDRFFFSSSPAGYEGQRGDDEDMKKRTIDRT